MSLEADSYSLLQSESDQEDHRVSSSISHSFFVFCILVDPRLSIV